MHTVLRVHTGSGVKTPADLRGKRVGIDEYQTSQSLWIKGVLERDFGIETSSIEWWIERSSELSHGGATGFVPPEGVTLRQIPSDKSLPSMLVSNEIDAAPVHRAFQMGSNFIDKSTRIRGLEGDWSKIVPLFPDIRAEAKRFISEYGFVPANHTIVIRGDIHRQFPWLALNLALGIRLVVGRLTLDQVTVV